MQRKMRVSKDKPTVANTVAEIKNYLDANGISYDNSAKKDELLALIK